MSDFLDLSNINIVTNSLLSEEKFHVLRGLSPLNMRILNGACRLIDVAQGVETLHEGDTPRDLYFIQQGYVSISKEIGHERKVITTLKAGDIFGEFAILRNKNRYASVYTSASSQIIRVTADAIRQVLEADQGFQERLQSILAKRMLNSFLFCHPIFQTLPEHLRQLFSQDLEIICTSCDTRILSQGEETHGITLIISGSVEVYHTDASGKEHLLEIRRNHDVLGELAIEEGKKSAYSATAASDLDLLPLNNQAMLYIKNKHAETFKRLEVYIHKRAQLTAKRLSEKT